MPEAATLMPPQGSSVAQKGKFVVGGDATPLRHSPTFDALLNHQGSISLGMRRTPDIPWQLQVLAKKAEQSLRRLQRK